MKAAALACVLLVSGVGSVAFAQTPQRLARPVVASEMGADDRLHVSRDATIGNIAVDQYTSIGGHLSAPGLDRRAVGNGVKPILCSPDGVGPMAAHQLEVLLPTLSAGTRAQLKARDEAALNDLAVVLAASFDGVSADAIRADEVLGPGVYHSAIIGFSTALDVCEFFGLEQRL